MLYHKLYGVTTKYPKTQNKDQSQSYLINDLPKAEPIDYGYIRDLNNDYVEFYDKSFFGRGGVVGFGLIGLFCILFTLLYIAPGLFINFHKDGYIFIVISFLILIIAFFFILWFLGFKNFISFRDFPIRFNRTLKKVYFPKIDDKEFVVDWHDLTVIVEKINIKSDIEYYEIKFKSKKNIEQPFYLVRKVSNEKELLEFLNLGSKSGGMLPLADLKEIISRINRDHDFPKYYESGNIYIDEYIKMRGKRILEYPKDYIVTRFDSPEFRQIQIAEGLEKTEFFLVQAPKPIEELDVTMYSGEEDNKTWMA